MALTLTPENELPTTKSRAAEDAPSFRFTRRWSAATLYYGAFGGSARDLLRRVLFVPPPDLKPTELANELSLAQSWQVPHGVYAFLGRDPGADTTLLQRLDDYLDLEGNRDVGVVWIDNPNGPFGDWQTTALHLGERAGSRAPLAAGGVVSLRNYALSLPAGGVLSVDSEAVSFAVTGNTTFAADHAAPLPVQGPVTVDIADGGRLAWGLTLRAGGTPGDADTLDIGCRFYWSEGNGIASQRYPVFDTSTTEISLQARLDPFAPLDPQRTAFAFGPLVTPLPSFYRTVEGHAVSLTPREHSALLFAGRPGATPSHEERLTLVPTGPFSIDFGAAAKPRLRCGLSGAECFTPPAQGATLTFVAGQPAFASLDERPRGTTPPALDDRATTSWIRLSAKTAIDYWAQPDGACLYGGADVKRPGVLTFTPVVAGALPANEASPPAPQEAIDSFPMPPYAGIASADSGDCRRLESGAIGPTRRSLVYSATPAPKASRSPHRAANAAAPTTAVTPQGFLATFTDGAWSRLAVARNGDDSLAFTNLTGSLRAALLASQPFIVISDPRAVAASFTEHEVQLEGWTLDLDPGRWDGHGTMAIIKHCPRPLRELVDELGAWTLARELNVSPARTQARLQDIIRDAERSRAERTPSAAASVSTPAAGDSDYTHFLDTVVDDPAWNGVLFLDVPVSAGGGSEALSAVLAATDPRKLKAHHFGLGPTPVGGSPLQMGDSSFFGLIRYRETLAPAGQVSQRFQVLDIGVLFDNSRVASFRSRIALTLNRLFGAPASQRGGAGSNALMLLGSYQRRAAAAAYIFVQEGPTAFDLSGSALRAIEIDRAQFGISPAHADDDGVVAAAFTFWGSLRFATLNGDDGPLDLLSYDSLVFSGLVLRFQFPRRAPTDQHFTLDVTGVQFDPGASVTRAGALADHFPVTARGMISSAEAQAPGALGYMTVATPQLQTSGLGVPWYALVLDVNLGTAGGLASEAGLNASLALTWAPGSDGRSFAVGLKLPGSSGAASAIGIQGVMALDIYSIELVGDGGFALTLNGVTLSFFKKTLPPGGSFDIYLFGGVTTGHGPGALGWYGAYRKDRKA